jgi:hypothetical protein
MTPHVHRWTLGQNVAGVTPGRCACGATRVFTDEPAGKLGRLKRDSIRDDKAPPNLIVDPLR